MGSWERDDKLVARRCDESSRCAPGNDGRREGARVELVPRLSDGRDVAAAVDAVGRKGLSHKVPYCQTFPVGLSPLDDIETRPWLTLHC